MEKSGRSARKRKQKKSGGPVFSLFKKQPTQDKSQYSQRTKKASGGGEKLEKSGRSARKKKKQGKKEEKTDSAPAWQHDQATKKMVKANAFSTDACKTEFNTDLTFQPPKDDCGAFQKNLKKNRQPEAPITDSNMVFIKEPADAYLCAAKITNPVDSSQLILLTQAPEAADLEIFWKMVFDGGITNIFLATSPSALSDYLPLMVTSFNQVGKMLLNNKKVETLGKDTTCMTIEVLPDGCSNSIMCDVYSVASWGPGKVSPNPSDCIAICEKMLIKPGEGVMFCSWNGLGRSGVMLMIYLIMAHVIKNADFKINELFSKIRAQRFGIVENCEQYLSIYQALAIWIRNNSKDLEILKAIEGIPPPA